MWTVPTNQALPYGMVNAPDGSIWLALFGTNKLGRLDGETGELREITLPEGGARPRRLVVDETGMVWYSDYARGSLGRLDPANGSVKAGDIIVAAGVHKLREGELVKPIVDAIVTGDGKVAHAPASSTASGEPQKKDVALLDRIFGR